jgi:hypothetical protein
MDAAVRGARPEKDVKAEHALQQRRGGERNVLLGAFRNGDPDHPFLCSEEQLPGRCRLVTIIVMRLILLIASLLAASALASGVGAASSQRVLVAKVGLHDSYRISLTLANGRRVRTLPAGTYTIVVHDYSKLHNFALGSVTQNRRLFTGSVVGTGTKRYSIGLTAGTYAYACSAHPQTMHATFTVVTKT